MVTDGSAQFALRDPRPMAVSRATSIRFDYTICRSIALSANPATKVPLPLAVLFVKGS